MFIQCVIIITEFNETVWSGNRVDFIAIIGKKLRSQFFEIWKGSSLWELHITHCQIANIFINKVATEKETIYLIDPTRSILRIKKHWIYWNKYGPVSTLPLIGEFWFMRLKSCFAWFWYSTSDRPDCRCVSSRTDAESGKASVRRAIIVISSILKVAAVVVK